MNLEDITQDQLSLLASIFYQPPFESILHYERRVQDVFSNLEPALLRPSLRHRVVQWPQSFYTPLCGLHRNLDAKMVHSIFVLLATEVGIRLNHLVVAGRDKLGHEIWDRSILNLRSLHGAWLHPDVLEETFGTTLRVPQGGHTDIDYMIKWPYEDDKCEACILARVGGDLGTVLDLYMVAKSRIHQRASEKQKVPRLLGLCEEWLKIWGARFKTDQWKAKVERNQLRASRLESIRREIAKDRRRAKGTSHRMSGNRSAKPGQQRSRTSHRTRRHREQLEEGSQSEVHRNTSSPQRESAETIDVYLSPNMTPDPPTDSGHSDGEAGEIGHKDYEVENEIIDCYAALISTPFLPGMGHDEHQKRVSILSQSGIATQSQDTYLPPRQQWDKTTNLSRSQSVPKKRYSDQSWITMSVAPSTVSTQFSGLKPAQPTKFESKFRTIAEENNSRHSNIADRRERNAPSQSPVSPMDEDDRRRADRQVSNSSASLIRQSSTSAQFEPMSQPTVRRSSSHRQHSTKDRKSYQSDRDGGRTTRTRSRISTVPDLPANVSTRDSVSTVSEELADRKRSQVEPGGIWDFARQLREPLSPSTVLGGRDDDARHEDARRRDLYY